MKITTETISSENEEHFLRVKDNYFANIKDSKVPLIEISSKNKDFTTIENQIIYVLKSDTPFIQTFFYSKFKLLNTKIISIEDDTFIKKQSFKNRLLFLITNDIKYLK